jgi:hypothetical protein
MLHTVDEVLGVAQAHNEVGGLNTETIDKMAGQGLNGIAYVVISERLGPKNLVNRIKHLIRLIIPASARGAKSCKD